MCGAITAYTLVIGLGFLVLVRIVAPMLLSVLVDGTYPEYPNASKERKE